MTDLFRVGFIENKIIQLQSLYPYAIFLSPAFLVRDKRCSICGKKISPRASCGHIVGEIYDGEMCHRVVHEADLIEISFVEDPVNKYAVPFLKDEESGTSIDHYNYTMVNYVATGLRQPFDEWHLKWTKRRQPHDRYREFSEEAPCPCGSEMKYGLCCLREEGVLKRHAQIFFQEPPPPGLPSFGYIDDIKLLGEGVIPQF